MFNEESENKRIWAYCSAKMIRGKILKRTDTQNCVSYYTECCYNNHYDKNSLVVEGWFKNNIAKIMFSNGSVTDQILVIVYVISVWNRF